MSPARRVATPLRVCAGAALAQVASWFVLRQLRGSLVDQMRVAEGTTRDQVREHLVLLNGFANWLGFLLVVVIAGAALGIVRAAAGTAARRPALVALFAAAATAGLGRAAVVTSEVMWRGTGVDGIILARVIFMATIVATTATYLAVLQVARTLAPSARAGLGAAMALLTLLGVADATLGGVLLAGPSPAPDAALSTLLRFLRPLLIVVFSAAGLWGAAVLGRATKTDGAPAPAAEPELAWRLVAWSVALRAIGAVVVQIALLISVSTKTFFAAQLVLAISSALTVMAAMTLVGGLFQTRALPYAAQRAPAVWIALAAFVAACVLDQLGTGTMSALCLALEGANAGEFGGSPYHLRAMLDDLRTFLLLGAAVGAIGTIALLLAVLGTAQRLELRTAEGDARRALWLLPLASGAAAILGINALGERPALGALVLVGGLTTLVLALAGFTAQLRAIFALAEAEAPEPVADA
jgi:hypothetical protein